jgi:putative ABC transport system substrate-binding protein
MKRREFITLVGGAAAAWPLAARAQQQAMSVVGFIGFSSAADWKAFVNAFQHGLAESGYTEGRNVAVQYRWAEYQTDRLPAIVADLIAQRVAVLVPSAGIVSALAAKTATSITPIVFIVGGDPVKLGLVKSLNRPGGNLTGVSFLLNVLVAKRMQVLHDLVPHATVAGLLINPNNPNADSDARDAISAASALGAQIRQVEARSDFEAAFARLSEQRVAALFVASDSLFLAKREPLVDLAARYAVPAIYDRKELPEAGGLISYGTSFAEAHRQAGVYTGRILAGEKPADLPVMQATKFELVINQRAAKALGLEVPANLLAIADEVIE